MNWKRSIIYTMMALSTIGAQAENQPKTVYMYGFGASFNDSTVYITDIQQMDSAYVDSKTGFLYGRADYSYQLRTYLEAQGMADPTCITAFATDRKKAEKKYLKLRKRYLSGNRNLVKYVKQADFRFTAVRYEKPEAAADAATSAQ